METPARCVERYIHMTCGTGMEKNRERCGAKLPVSIDVQAKTGKVMVPNFRESRLYYLRDFRT
jgi:hypothetical protein